MFCPKCGSQNSDETKFCRGCGADVGNVLAVIENRPVSTTTEKEIETYASGLRNLMVGIGFLIVSGVSFGISIRLAVLGVFALAFAVVFLSTGISRFVQSRALRRLHEPRQIPSPAPSLTSGETDYIKPTRSVYETDDLVAQAPGSVTDHTTRHLEMDPESRSTK